MVRSDATPRQGEIWWASAHDKRRPVLVVTRSQAVPALSWIVVAPVTRTVRGIPTEVALGPPHGLDVECAASFDNLQPLRLDMLSTRVGVLRPEELSEVCRALSALADC